jgi:hypothetical protein
MPTSDFDQQLAEQQDVFVWEAPAYDRHERSSRWYLAMTIVAALLVGYAIWTGNFLFAFLVLLVAIILVLAGNEHAPASLMQIGHNGIVWDGDFLPFDRIGHFAIVYQPPHVKVLYIQPKSLLHPRLRIQLGEQDPIVVRNHLKQYAAEDLNLREEHISDVFARLLRL